MATQATPKHNVGMGQIVVSDAPARLTAVLGSCVGVSLFHPRFKTGALAHVVLPKANGTGALPGKFVDTALPHMLDSLSKKGIPRHGLVAKLAGGSCMFGAAGPLQIGNSNIEAATALLAKEGVPVVGTDLGGEKGRRVTLDCSTGELVVEIAGKDKTIL